MLMRVSQKILNIILLLFFILALLVTLMGVDIPSDLTRYKKVGIYKVLPYKYGLYITKPNTDSFYNVSPYDMYYDTNDVDKVINIADNIISLEERRKGYKFLAVNIIDTLKSYFGTYIPTANFGVKDRHVDVTTSFNNKNVTFTLQDPATSEKQPKVLNAALSFNQTDYIIDDQNFLYSIESNDRLEEFEKLLNITTSPILALDDKVTLESSASVVKILNPKSNVGMEVQAQTENCKVTGVDRKYRLILFACNAENYGKTIPAFEVTLYDSLKEVVK